MEFHSERQGRENVEEDDEEEENEEELDVDMMAGSGSMYPNRLTEGQTAAVPNPKPIRYKECRKNHAVGIGGHAVDGCGEFIASGADGTLDALVCAACNCHRNFHRKESYRGALPLTIVDRGTARGQYPVYRDPHWYTPPMGPPALQHHPRPLALPPVNAGMFDLQEDAWASPVGAAGGGSGSSRKRFRTKFTQEQKDRMLSLAEKLGWRIQKQDEAEVDRFCCETGVKKQVLKVWMHNNKNTLSKKP